MPIKSSRCQMRNIHGGKRCASKICHTLNKFNRPYCYVHLTHIFCRVALILQNHFRSNKKRRAISIYKNLPSDLQRKILFIMQENDLIKKHHHNVIENILIKRFNNGRIKRSEILFNLGTTLGLESGLINEENKMWVENYLDDLYHFLELIIKYNEIVSYSLHDAISWELLSVEKYILDDILLNLVDLHTYYVLTNGKLIWFYLHIYLERVENECRLKIYHIYSQWIKNSKIKKYSFYK